MNAIIGSQAYCWFQIYNAQGQKYQDHLDEIFAQVRAAGVEAWEGGVASPEDAAHLRDLLAKHRLAMPSIYVGASLHRDSSNEGIEDVLRQARLARPLGASIVVVNPDPIDWHKPINKSDNELKRQAEAMQTLGQKLLADGMTLAYHTHDPEMRAAAREFHHMLLATDPECVGLCLDAHWIYRGAENSQVALYDIVKLYLSRIRSLHLRQSQNGIWTETLCDGDIDYRPLARRLNGVGFAGPIIIEQCFEKGTPQTVGGDERIRRSRQWLRDALGL